MFKKARFTIFTLKQFLIIFRNAVWQTTVTVMYSEDFVEVQSGAIKEY